MLRLYLHSRCLLVSSSHYFILVSCNLVGKRDSFKRLLLFIFIRSSCHILLLQIVISIVVGGIAAKNGENFSFVAVNDICRIQIAAAIVHDYFTELTLTIDAFLQHSTAFTTFLRPFRWWLYITHSRRLVHLG